MKACACFSTIKDINAIHLKSEELCMCHTINCTQDLQITLHTYLPIIPTINSIYVCNYSQSRLSNITICPSDALFSYNSSC